MNFIDSSVYLLAIMEVKSLLFVLAICVLSVKTAEARYITRRDPCQCPQEKIYFSNLATPCPHFIESIDYIPKCRKTSCNCGCKNQLILPPVSVEMPCGLGYFPSASPLVTKYYAPALDNLTTGAYIPVASSCDSFILAAPVSPEYAPLVKPIIL